MKKNILLVIILSLFLPCIVLADVGGPISHTYYVAINNPNGIKIYDFDPEDYNMKETNQLLTSDEKIKVIFEEIYDNVLYLYIELNNDYYYIKKDDVSVIDSEIEKEKYEQPFELYAYKDVEVYEGPSIVYKKIGTIPKGNTLKIEYGTDSNVWVYAEYKDIKGYVYSIIDSGVEAYNTRSSLAIKNTEKVVIKNIVDISYLLEEPTNDAKKIDFKIKKNSEMIYDYVYGEAFNDFYHVTIDGVEGWIPQEFLVIEPYNNYIVFHTSNIVAFSEFNSRNRVDTSKIKQGIAYPIKYVNTTTGNQEDVWYEIEAEGNIYYIFIEFGTEFNLETDEPNYDYFQEKIKFTIDKKLDCYKDVLYYDEEMEKVATLEPGEYIAYRSGEVIYVENVGYVKESDIDKSKIEVLKGSIKKPTLINSDKKNKSNNTETILYCVGGAVVLCLTCIVIMKLINKKKSVENVESNK